MNKAEKQHAKVLLELEQLSERIRLAVERGDRVFFGGKELTGFASGELVRCARFTVSVE